MPVISYLVYPKVGAKNRLTADVRNLAGCEVVAAENRDLLVVVAESANATVAGELEQRLLTLEGCAGVSLVAAFETQEGGQ